MKLSDAVLVSARGCTCHLEDVTAFGDLRKETLYVRDPGCPVHVEPAVEDDDPVGVCAHCSRERPVMELTEHLGEWWCVACTSGTLVQMITYGTSGLGKSVLAAASWEATMKRIYSTSVAEPRWRDIFRGES